MSKALLLYAIVGLSFFSSRGEKYNGNNHMDTYSFKIKTLDKSETDQPPPCNMFTLNYKTVSKVSCNHYLECSNGELTTGKCPWLQKFNPSTSGCKLFGADCGGKPAPIPNPWPQFDCRGRKDFKTTSPWGCKYYLECSGGSLKVGECPWIWPKFQQSTQECRNAFVGCDDRPFPLPTPLPPSTAATSPGTPTPSGAPSSTSGKTASTSKDLPTMEPPTGKPTDGPPISTTENLPFTSSSRHSSKGSTEDPDMPTMEPPGTSKGTTGKDDGMPTMITSNGDDGDADAFPTWDTLNIDENFL